MEYWWKENKKFAMTIGGALAFVMVWYFFMISPVNAGTDAKVRARTGEEMKLRNAMAAGVPSDDSVHRAKNDRDNVDREIKVAQAATEFKIEESFTATNGRTPEEAFTRQRQEVYKQLLDKARQKSFPSFDERLGFGSPTLKDREELAREYLKRLALVRRVCMLAIENCEKIDKIIPINTGGGDQDEPVVHADRFLNTLTLKMTIQSSGDGLIRFLHGLQQKGSFLALEEFKMQLGDASRDLLITEITVSGIILNPAAPIEPEKKEP